MAKQLARELISAGAHFGHSSNRWNPKMKPFIFAKRGNIHIIDVRKTIKSLLIAKKLLARIAGSGKDIVFVGTKRQAQDAAKAAAEKCGMHFVNTRWLGGTLTNFRTIRSRVQRLEELEAMQVEGTLENQSKKQASRLKHELRKIKNNLDGIRKMSRLPGAVVAVDGTKEYLALREARKLQIATIGLLDTNCDPDEVDLAIPINDDSIRAVQIILNELSDAAAIGKTQHATREKTQKPRRTRSRTVLARAEETRNDSTTVADDSDQTSKETKGEKEAEAQQG